MVTLEELEHVGDTTTRVLSPDASQPDSQSHVNNREREETSTGTKRKIAKSERSVAPIHYSQC